MCELRKRIKIICAHIEWSTASMFVSLASLAVAMIKSWTWWAVGLAAFAIILAIFAAFSSYAQKSIDRMIQYDRNYDNLRAVRRSAAAYLLNRGGRYVDRCKVLDFFDTPLGHLTERGYLDEQLVYDYFIEEIRGWWTA